MVDHMKHMHCKKKQCDETEILKICPIGVADRERDKRGEDFQKTSDNNFPKLMGDINTKIKMLGKTQNLYTQRKPTRMNILKAAIRKKNKKNRHSTFKRTITKQAADFSTEVILNKKNKTTN